MNRLRSMFGGSRGRELVKYAGRGEEFKYWHRFVERFKDEHVNLKIFKPLVGLKYISGRRNWYYNEKRPWTREGLQQNFLRMKPPKVLVEPIKEWNLFVGDNVRILVGRDKGKIGEICEIVHERNWIFVESLHTKLDMKNGKEFAQKIEMPLLINEVKLVDPSDMKPTEIEWRYTEEGERVRVSARTGRIIPIPTSHLSLWEDYTYALHYNPSEKDTMDSDLTTTTFKPKLSTFEEDICKTMGVKYEKRKERSFWY